MLALAGTGAKAHIYLAEKESDGTHVAIKHIVCDGNRDESAIRQVMAEHEAANRFTHPNLRRSLEIHFKKKWMKTQEVILVMEYVDGDSLESFSRNRDIRDVTGLFCQTALGLRAMHQIGVVHADLKPGNILVSMDGQVKIIDFGQSCPIGTAKRKIQGTLDYIPPEQVHREELDARCDVFSLGATMYFVLTGHPIATEMNQQLSGDHAAGLLGRKPRRGAAWDNLDLPPSLTKLIEDCCQPNRDDRPRDMGTVLSRLELVQASLERNPPAHQMPDGLDDTRIAPAEIPFDDD